MGARIKFKWAERHCNLFSRDVTRYLDSEDPIPFQLKRNPKPPKYALHIHVRQPAPTAEWSLMVGDAIHNFRASLDYLAWQLATRKLKREPTDKQAKSIQFPIALCPSDFPGRYGTHIAADDLDIIERFQPYHRRHPHRHPLAVLNKLSNRDKHRVPQVTVPVLDCLHRRFHVSGGTVKKIRRRRYLPMEHDAKAVTFEVHDITAPPAEVDYHGDPAFYVAFASGESVWGSEGSVLGSLIRIGERVVKILNRFGPTF